LRFPESSNHLRSEFPKKARQSPRFPVSNGSSRPSLTHQVRSSVWIYLGFYIILFLSAVVVLILSLNVLWQTAGWAKPDFVALGGALIALYLDHHRHANKNFRVQETLAITL
jgi:hypothetical protein